MRFNSQAMDVPTGEEVIATNSDTAKSITSAADVIAQKTTALKRGYNQIERVANQELAEPNITAETTNTITRLKAIAAESLCDGCNDLIHAMSYIETVLPNV
jgi:hypothetical protein